jgi:hypothetical protein
MSWVTRRRCEPGCARRGCYDRLIAHDNVGQFGTQPLSVENTVSGHAPEVGQVPHLLPIIHDDLVEGGERIGRLRVGQRRTRTRPGRSHARRAACARPSSRSSLCRRRRRPAPASPRGTPVPPARCPRQPWRRPPVDRHAKGQVQRLAGRAQDFVQLLETGPRLGINSDRDGIRSWIGGAEARGNTRFPDGDARRIGPRGDCAGPRPGGLRKHAGELLGLTWACAALDPRPTTWSLLWVAEPMGAIQHKFANARHRPLAHPLEMVMQ